MKKTLLLLFFHFAFILAAMAQDAKEIVKKENLDYLWLAVWEKNEQAIKFYEKHKFKIFGEHDFILGTDIQKDYLMKLK